MGNWDGVHSSLVSIRTVHTTFVAEWSIVLSGKAAGSCKSAALQENISRNIDQPMAEVLSSFLKARKTAKQTLKEPQIFVGGFDACADTTLLLLESPDAYVYPR